MVDLLDSAIGTVCLLKIKKMEANDNSDKKGNIRDYADVSQLLCLANLENLNAHFINEGMPQKSRLERLNQIAIQQMRILADASRVRMLEKSDE